MALLVNSLSATWQPFVLVVGLLLIGHVASSEGLFEALGRWCAAAPGGGVALFVVTMAAVAAVTAVLNLDTSIVFMTPVALHAARSKGVDETAFVFGAAFMSNSASLLLIGSNLTNILVVANTSTTGAQYTRHTWIAWLLAVAVVVVVIVVWRLRGLTTAHTSRVIASRSLTLGPGVVATVVAVATMVTIRHPALVVIAAGVIAEAWSWLRRHATSWHEIVAVVNPRVVGTLFVVAVGVGLLARHWSYPEHVMAHANVLATALVASVCALALNNLPAASLFAAHPVAHPYALLLGLDVAPSCLITGALSSLLWRRIVTSEGHRVSLVTFSVVGTIITILTLLVSLPVIG